MNHLIDIQDLSKAEIEKMIEVAKDIIKTPTKYENKCNHKKLATLFFEPSTRTRLSFEAAMLELRRKYFRIFISINQLRSKRRKRIRHNSRRWLLCRHYSHKASKRRCTTCCIIKIQSSNNKCRWWWTQSSHTNINRSINHFI